MHIVHFMTQVHLEVGGPARVLLDLCAALAGAGNRVTLATVVDTDVPSARTRNGGGAGGLFDVVKLPGPLKENGRISLGAVRRMDALLCDADVLHIHEVWSVGSVQIAAVARRRGVPYVLTTHGTLDAWAIHQKRLKKSLFLMLFGRFLLGGAAVLHFACKGELEQAARWLFGARSVVLPFVFDLSSYFTPLASGAVDEMLPELSDPRPKVLFLGRVVATKGVELLLHAAARARRSGSSFLVVIAGPCRPEYLAALRALAARLSIEDMVLFTGMVRGDLKAALLQRCDLFCLPTEHESFGVVILEAMAAGLPVVTTPNVHLSRDLDSDALMIVERSAAAWGEAITNLLADSSRRRRLGERGRDCARRYMDPRRVVAGYQAMYEGARRRSRP